MLTLGHMRGPRVVSATLLLDDGAALAGDHHLACGDANATNMVDVANHIGAV